MIISFLQNLFSPHTKNFYIYIFFIRIINFILIALLPLTVRLFLKSCTVYYVYFNQSVSQYFSSMLLNLSRFVLYGNRYNTNLLSPCTWIHYGLPNRFSCYCDLRAVSILFHTSLFCSTFRSGRLGKIVWNNSRARTHKDGKVLIALLSIYWRDLFPSSSSLNS